MVKRAGTIIIIIVLSLTFGVNAQTITSKFRPLSYDEMMAPIVAAQNFHNQCCESLIGLMDAAEKIEPYINKEKDPITWRRYADYYNSIVDEYNRINKNGTNQRTRSNINNLRKNFSIINGIGNAYNKRNELAEHQYRRIQAIHCNPDRLYIDISLDEFLDGKTPSVNYN